MLTIKHYSDAAAESGLPRLRVLACIGGDPLKNQIETIKRFYNKIMMIFYLLCL